jgi:hypothetical protein
VEERAVARVVVAMMPVGLDDGQEDEDASVLSGSLVAMSTGSGGGLGLAVRGSMRCGDIS